MGSNYTLIIRFLLGAILIVMGANLFVPFSGFLNFTGELLGFTANDLFYGLLFLVSGVSVLFKKAMPVALIILAFFAIQVLSHFLANNPKGILSPIGVVAFLVMLNIIDNKNRFKNLFY